MLNYRPEQILIDVEVENSLLALEICDRFSDVPQLILEQGANHKKILGLDPGRNPLTQGKKNLHLKYFQGHSFKSCPGFSEDLLCCNYFTLDLVENCPFECTYCILQAFLNKPLITVHANLEEILENLKNQISTRSRQLYRVGTGEHSDSLALDPYLRISPHLIRFFSNLPNAILELKTKSHHVDHLLDLPHGGKTVIAWSLNPETIIEQEEYKTARLDERLEAARKASDAGYKLGFHFDPMLHFPGWEKEYPRLVERLFDSVSPERIAWISMGTLRCLPMLKPIVEDRFPSSRVFLGELFQSDDGKLRYLKRIRQEMIRLMQQELQKHAPGVPNYICMDKPSVWRNSMPSQPEDSSDLEATLEFGFLQTEMERV